MRQGSATVTQTHIQQNEYTRYNTSPHSFKKVKNKKISCLINDGLHVGLVGLVSVEQGGPLVRGDAQPPFHGDLHDLGVVLAPQGLVRTELLLQLHEGRVLVTLGHLQEI